MSEKALLYAGLDLKNRFLIIQEAAGLAEGPGRVFMRQLLTEGEVRYVTVQSTSTGLVGKELPRRRGAYWPHNDDYCQPSASRRRVSIHLCSHG